MMMRGNEAKTCMMILIMIDALMLWIGTSSKLIPITIVTLLNNRSLT